MNTDNSTRELRRSAWIGLGVILVIGAFLLAALVVPARAESCMAKYTVGASETLQDIADLYKVRLRDLARVNSLKKPYRIEKGQVLCIPSQNSQSSDPTPGPNDGFTFDVSFLSTTFIIEAGNMPGRNTYYVILENDTRRIKAGMLRTANGGKVRMIFDLNEPMRSSKEVNVCLKNITSNASVCRKYTRRLSSP